jgi:hypothetical protein
LRRWDLAMASWFGLSVERYSGRLGLRRIILLPV